MSILIKGMEMPASCRACHLKMNCDDCEGLKCVCLPLQTQIGYLDDLLTDKRRNDCPLVPVPPHGRLIDADILYRVAVDRAEKRGDMFNEMDNVLSPRCIKMTPTALPADEGGPSSDASRHLPPGEGGDGA